ncbi:MAG TPA: DUF45 domain-containing protein, partial [Saprospiraceae bacterium]|nr:DUF45 domain-containing protein [Saprospiraceae bacterium]
MLQRRPKSRTYRHHIEAAGLHLPVDIVLEARSGFRFGITHQRVTLRLPAHTPPEAIHQKLGELQEWVHKTLLAKPKLRQQFLPKEYHTGQVLEVGGRQYTLDVRDEDRD